MTSTFRLVWSPRRMMEPLPYIFSMFFMAVWMASFLSLATVAVFVSFLSFSAMMFSFLC
mgnify:CR=1 FL=1